MFRHLLTPPCNRVPSTSTLLICARGNKNLGLATNTRYIFTQVTRPQIQELPASTAVNGNEPLASVSLLDVKIPYLPQLDPHPLVQIPYVPDFWDSSSPSIEPVSNETLPKLLVVAGVGTHHGGGPSHNLLDISSEPGNGSPDSITADSPGIRSEERGLWGDIADDIGLPPPKDVKNTFWKLFL